MPEEVVHTPCRICGAFCGLDVTVDTEHNEVVSIEPDRKNPYTWRDFCRKGKTAAEVATHPRRILGPMRRVGDRYEVATYEEATADIAERLTRIIEADGPDAVASYQGNPMATSFGTSIFWAGLLDAIGTGNRFWVGSIDQNSWHVVRGEMFGSEMIGLPTDIDDCDCFLLVGMDPAVSRFVWVDLCPGGWQRVLERQRSGADVIVVDPRRSRSAEQAGTHIAPLPGQDWAFLLGLVKVILDEGLERMATAVPVAGEQAIRVLAADADLTDLAGRCDVPVPVIEDVARRFARARTASCITRTGVSMHEHGTLGEWLGMVLNVITDRVDVAGGQRFERGFVDVVKLMSAFAPASPHISRLRGLPTIAGYHSLAELPDEITTPGPGQVRAFFCGYGNPVISGPDGRALDAALSQLDLYVSLDLVQRESHRHADWLIPGTHWLERAEVHPLLGNLQERPFVQASRQAIRPPDTIKPEWEFLADLALALDRNLFGKPGVNRFIKATRALARLSGRPALAFNPGWVERAMVASGRRLKYKDIVARPHGWRYSQARFGDLADSLQTPDKRVHLGPPRILAECRRVVASPSAEADPRFPFILMTKRHREAMNSWLNESPGLFARDRNNKVEIHPDDAAALGIEDGDVVEVTSSTGSIQLPAVLSDGQRRGVVCIPHGWGSRIFDPAGDDEPLSYGVNRNVLTDNRRIDPLSQTPAFNSTAVKITSSRSQRTATPAAS